LRQLIVTRTCRPRCMLDPSPLRRAQPRRSLSVGFRKSPALAEAQPPCWQLIRDSQGPALWSSASSIQMEGHVGRPRALPLGLYWPTQGSRRIGPADVAIEDLAAMDWTGLKPHSMLGALGEPRRCTAPRRNVVPSTFRQLRQEVERRMDR